MTVTKLDRLLKELAQAELEDERLHTRPSSLEERVRSHERLNELRAEVAILRGTNPTPARRVHRGDQGVRLFPPGS